MKDKVVIVTGASSGIGKALAEKYAAEGSKVVLAARSKEKLDKLAEKLNAAGGKALAVKTDVSQKEACQNLIDEAVKHFGGIDILVNNAGISMRALFQDAKLEVIEQLMQVNFWSMVYCTKFALPHLLKTQGSIVNVSSVAGYRGLPGRTGYSASKFAMGGFSEALRTELLKTGVHVLLACPHFTASNIRNVALNASGNPQGDSPMKETKLMTSEAVAAGIYKAVRKRKRSIAFTRQGKLTIWMNKHFPKLTDKLVYNHFAKEPDSPLK